MDTSDAAMRATIEKFNELCDVITEIGNFRKLPNPPITGYEFHVIQLVSEVCPHDLILPYLKETLAEIKSASPSRSSRSVRASWSPAPRSTIPSSRSSSRAAARWSWPTATASAASRAASASRIRDGETAFDAIVRHYLHWSQCARFMEGANDPTSAALRSSALSTSSMPTA